MTDNQLARAELVAARHARSPIPMVQVVDPSDVPVVDNGEPLVALTLSPRLTYLASYVELGLDGASEVAFLRRSVASTLDVVVKSLPDEFGLAIFDAWRSMRTVTDLFERTTSANPDLDTGYVADPNDATLVPPHTTGGAVDLTLLFEGQPLLLGTPFDHFDRDAWTASSERVNLGCQHLRRLLYWGMRNAGFANYAFEWWHYSLGDQMWALDTEAPSATFGAITPSP